MQQIAAKKNESLRKKYKAELIAVKNFNRRVANLNLLREQQNKRDFDLAVAEWKLECDKIRERNQIRTQKTAAKNDALKNVCEHEKSLVDDYNKTLLHINAHRVKVFNKTNKQIIINNDSVIVFSDDLFEQYADIVIEDEKQIGQISYFLHKDTVKLFLLDEQKYVFVKKSEWGYEGVDGEYYGFLNTKEVPKFNQFEYELKKTPKFIPTLINLEKLPEKPKFVAIKKYQQKPLPIIPMEYAVAVEFNDEKYKFDFGKWKI